MALPDNSGHSLCYEIHGDDGKHFNLISDTCVSVNAHFTAMNTIRNRISVIGIHAVSDSSLNGCVDIQINSTCNARVGETEVDSAIIGGINVVRYGNRWRVSVLNCDQPSTVMWVTCMEGRLLFHVTRGSNLAPTSHGLLGMCVCVCVCVRGREGRREREGEREMIKSSYCQGGGGGGGEGGR